ncbi:MAG TPA: nuclear transport factor 2 family protein [Natronosporangium sp.]|jgi:ketosteroid isomerase-like protein|nr:nuclear transport factor 2 family protein [Natronosporangium sp.]
MADDVAVLTELNEQFIEAVRRGSWEMLAPLLSPGFFFLNGATGEVVEREPYRQMIESGPIPELVIDQVVVRVEGDTAVVSARTSAPSRPGRYSRYLDTYARVDGEWRCTHACVWSLA